MTISSHCTLCVKMGYLRGANGSTPATAIRTRTKMLMNGCTSVKTDVVGGSTLVRSYFTNGDRIKKDDPYAALGLQWGDGATTNDIKDAFRKKARELHPDVNKTDTPEQSLKKFQQLQKAYESLMKASTNGISADIVPEEWRFSVWRQGDRIASDRTDVAGMLKKRPSPPAEASTDKNWGLRGQLGHPDGRGVTYGRRGEYIEDGSKPRRKTSSSVGRGLNKWVKPKEFKPWNPDNGDSKLIKGLSSIKTTKK